MFSSSKAGDIYCWNLETLNLVYEIHINLLDTLNCFIFNLKLNIFYCCGFLEIKDNLVGRIIYL